MGSLMLTQARILSLVSLSWLLLAAAAFGQDSITLRARATVEPGAPVSLGSVATLSGAAKSWADLVITEPLDGSAGRTITLQHVRTALKSRGGINFGTLLLSGGQCEVQPVSKAAFPEPTAPTIRESNPAASGGMRGLIIARLAAHYGVDTNSLQVTFSETDRSILDAPISDLTVLVQPTGSGDRVPLSIRVYQGDRLEQSASIRVGILIKRSVLVAQNPRDRGMFIGPEDYRREDRWLAPSAPQAATEASAIGSVLLSPLEAGAVILAKQVEPPIVVRRGDIVSIDCMSGSVMVRVSARATESGRDGDLVTFQSLTSKKTFDARMNGPGRAALVREEQSAPATPTSTRTQRD